MQSQFSTAITDLFGTRLPIVAGGLQWLANADYVAAAANAGVMGFITAASHATTAELRDEIARCQDLVGDLPFGVNVSMLPKPAPGERVQEIFEEIVRAGVHFVETSGRNPEPYLPFLHDAGIKVLHKAPSVRHARKAQAVGVDAVSVVGAECGGHPGVELVGTMVQGALAGRGFDIPVLLGGGIGTGAQVVAALALGVDGVTIGTRFLVAEEIWAHRDYKEALVRSRETDTALIMQSVRNTVRAFRNETTEQVAELERTHGGEFELLRPHVAGLLGRKVYETGDSRIGTLSLGQAVAFADRIEPLAAIVGRIEEEMREVLSSLSRLGGFTRPATPVLSSSTPILS
ncbi:nitronate monooxygenase [Variovorax guangxiensis]|uniref:NAD(P)H-dependent flavin oxidoreductase n=1 Tax=Variovorax guangxiensis TaxID=1775474 RepID=UPI00285CCA6F|nr:nitronate monooxygenase [Variovorax guangxiensis]MDR6858492.1 nitronate monooxygenase [Variovorax guangxiensis]